MPGFRSRAEQVRLSKLTDEGKFPRQDYDRLHGETNYKTLPERAPRKTRSTPADTHAAALARRLY